jgi:transposase-like protein
MAGRRDLGRIRGKWGYLYPAVDRNGKTVDVRLSAKRDVAAAKALFRKAIKTRGCTPQRTTLDGFAASHRAAHEMNADGTLQDVTNLRSSKYLNNVIEQDHRGIKLRLGPMLGFKGFRNAAIVITGIDLLRRIHKDQFDLGRLRLKRTTAPAIWNAVRG